MARDVQSETEGPLGLLRIGGVHQTFRIRSANGVDVGDDWKVIGRDPGCRSRVRKDPSQGVWRVDPDAV